RGEGWTDHARRLNARRAPPAYFVNYGIAEAADYGVPQLRQRLVIVAYRADIGHGWSLPTATHGQDRLLFDKWVSGDYGRDHGLPAPRVPAEMRAAVEQLEDRSPRGRRWKTVRDALVGLDDPAMSYNHGDHVGRPGARTYSGHRG